MGEYTEFFECTSENIYNESEDLIEELKETAKLFRTFDEALDTFIVNHGYDGELNDHEKKIDFVTGKFKEAEIPVPRNIKKWYSQHKAIERKTAFQICFAFRLSIEESNDFLRRICLFRGFDCHSMDEVVIYFALKNKLSYKNVQAILDELTVRKQGKISTDDVVYTEFIKNEIEQIESEQELVEYLSIHRDAFEYNNVRACITIRTLWESISKEDGLAIREKKILYDFFDDDDENIEDTSDCSVMRKERKRVDDSVWEIYLQLLGLSGNHASKYYQERSIKTILKNNELLHSLAEHAFPDRDGINKILNGEHLSYERVRKILILFTFYKFWVEKATTVYNYEAGSCDDCRCRAHIDDFLTEAGYPILYAGNPYDFIFLYANNTEYPLITFREYIRELFYLKNEGTYL